MASLCEIISHIYTTTLLLSSILLLQLAILLRAVARVFTDRPSITTQEFLKVVDELLPAQPYKTGLPFEPVECRVCLSMYEEGVAVRKLGCSHAFHKDCLDAWLQQDDATCPLCRMTALPSAVVVQHRNYRLQEYYNGTDVALRMILRKLHANLMRRFL